MSRWRLEPGSVVVGDLHLDPARAEDAADFVAWVGALEGPALVVVGDLFDAWVGRGHEDSPGGAAVIEAFRDATARGVAVHLLHGNRDFLLGESFERRSGARVHPDGMEVELGDGTHLLLVHGDELCTRDLAYQRLRRVLRSGPVIGLAERVPLALSQRVARRLRRASVAAVAAKPSAEKAMQEDAVRRLARERGAGIVLCGHAHRSRDERLSDGPRWIVLDAYGGRLDVARVGEQGLGLESSGTRDRETAPA